MDETAFKIFKLSSSGLCCTQIIMRLALDEEEKENVDLVKAFNGLCRGIGDSQKTCGVIIGGIGVLGLYAGKGSEREYPKDNFSKMLSEFTEWFETTFESTQCVDLIGVTSFTDQSNQEYRVKCGDILTRSYYKIREIVTDNGYELGNREL